MCVSCMTLVDASLSLYQDITEMPEYIKVPVFLVSIQEFFP